MNSMTGHGVGECSRSGVKMTVELSSVNRRQSEVAINLPRELEVLEAQIRAAINKQVARGRVTARVSLHPLEGREDSLVHLNRSLARAYARELSKLAAELNWESGPSLDNLMRAPGVLQNNPQGADATDYWPAVRSALKEALATLVHMRAREGHVLQQALKRHVAMMRKAVGRITRRAPQVLKRYREQLRERIRAAGLNPAEIDEERLSKEIVIFADRSDISEELTRLRSHFEQFDTYVEATNPVGRTLDFLAQEMNREINTIGAKANDAAISRDVVILKTEVEKFREQVQNIE